MNRDEMIAALFRLRDEGYALMQTKIIPVLGLGISMILGKQTADNT